MKKRLLYMCAMAWLIGRSLRCHDTEMQIQHACIHMDSKLGKGRVLTLKSNMTVSRKALSVNGAFVSQLQPDDRRQTVYDLRLIYIKFVTCCQLSLLVKRYSGPVSGVDV